MSLTVYLEISPTPKRRFFTEVIQEGVLLQVLENVVFARLNTFSANYSTKTESRNRESHSKPVEPIAYVIALLEGLQVHLLQYFQQIEIQSTFIF